MLRTRAPLSRKASSPIPSDLHVLGLPLAFILSQDQTLHCIMFCLLQTLLLKIEICSCLLGAWRLVHGVTALLHAPCASRILSTVSLFLLKLTVLIVVSRLQLFISNLATSDLELKTQDFYQPRCALLIIPMF